MRTISERQAPSVGLVLLVVGWVLLQSLAQRPDHDESQYVAGATLALTGIPFRDFMLLQPPLHAWLFAPIAWLWPTDIYIAMRLATGVLALATLMTVFCTMRSLKLPVRSAAAVAIMMGCCGSFQFCAGIVRNDMAAALLLALGTWALIHFESRRRKSTLIAGAIAFGLAMATKLSMAPIAVGAALHLLLDWRARPRAPWIFTGGVLIGLAPAVVAFTAAPEAFLWGVFTFGASAPFDWYMRIGAAHELTVLEKFTDLTGYLLVGPAWIALLMVVVRWSSVTKPLSGEARLLLILVLAGLIAGAMPTPTHKQYLLPLLPPLFVAFGLVLAESHQSKIRLTVIGVTALSGLVPTLVNFARIGQRMLPALSVDASGHEVGIAMRRAGLDGVIATLSPDRAVDSGFPLDPRFATGPFVFRSGGILTPSLAARLMLPTPSNLEAILHDQPPAAILVGYEHSRDPAGRSLDQQLSTSALHMGWIAERLPDGLGTLWYPPNG